MADAEKDGGRITKVKVATRKTKFLGMNSSKEVENADKPSSLIFFSNNVEGRAKESLLCSHGNGITTNSSSSSSSSSARSRRSPDDVSIRMARFGAVESLHRNTNTKT